MNTAGLLDYQIEPVKHLTGLLRAGESALDGSDMGTGKTFQAVGVIRELNLPTLVVVPAISIPGWKKAGEALGVEFDILSFESARTGNTPWGRWEFPPPKKAETYLQCESCQCVVDERKPHPCPHQYLGIHCVKVKKKEHNFGKFFWHENIKLLVVDEVHRCGALDSLQADMLVGARRSGLPVLGLSATAADSPLGLRALGYCLGLHSLVGPTGFYPWAQRRGCCKLPFKGFHFAAGEERKTRIMADLGAEIFPRHGVRVKISDLGDKFPECQITAELYDIAGSAKRMERLYRDMAEALAAVHEKRDLDNESAVVQLIRARQELELLKVPLLVELTNAAIEEGKHVALFVSFRSTVDELCRRLKTDCRVDGSQVGQRGARLRQQCVDSFQADESPVIVCSAAAGGIAISLHDLLGKFARLGLILPGFSAREFRQICGRLRRQGAKSKALYRAIFAAGTDDESVHRKLAPKLNCLDALNDGDFFASNLPLTNLELHESLV